MACCQVPKIDAIDEFKGKMLLDPQAEQVSQVRTPKQGCVRPLAPSSWPPAIYSLPGPAWGKGTESGRKRGEIQSQTTGNFHVRQVALAESYMTVLSIDTKSVTESFSQWHFTYFLGDTARDSVETGPK